MSTDQPVCLTCGRLATLTVAWVLHDPGTGDGRGRRWTGTPRPSCDFCADEDEANLPRLAHGPHVIGLHRIGDTA